MSEYFRRIDSMLSQHQMPPEYEMAASYVYCNDCEKKCYAKFHFLYHKCIHCKGYNTKVLQTLETKEGEEFDVLNARILLALAPTINADKAIADGSAASTSPATQETPELQSNLQNDTQTTTSS
jgi:hypothetical protein